jgi:hypothetical protein
MVIASPTPDAATHSLSTSALKSQHRLLRSPARLVRHGFGDSMAGISWTKFVGFQETHDGVCPGRSTSAFINDRTSPASVTRGVTTVPHGEFAHCTPIVTCRTTGTATTKAARTQNSPNAWHQTCGDTMLQQGVIRPSCSAFSTLVLLVRKRTIHDVFAWITKHQTLARSKISFPYQ